MPVTPDGLVARHGESVTHSVVTTAAYDSVGAFDEAASTIATATLKAIVSQPSSREQQLRYQGQADLRLTVPSGTDVSAQRAGRPDRFLVRGQRYEVLEVRQDKHPFVGTGVPKTTVVLTRLSDPPGALT